MTTDNLILLIDRWPIGVEAIRQVFKHYGATNPLRVVSDGVEALNYLLGREEYVSREKFPLPKLVFLNLFITQPTGFEFLTWLREQPQFRGIPVVVYAPIQSRIDIEQAYACGADCQIQINSNLDWMFESLLQLNQRVLSKVSPDAIIHFAGVQPGCTTPVIPFAGCEGTVS